ncbi:MAG TPA: RDD family protein, partial [Afipia sp.]
MSDRNLSDQATQPLYARFSRRFQGLVIDSIFTVTVAFSAVFLAVSVGNDNFSRIFGGLIIALLVLCEPLLVSFTGGSVGHHFTNLRVIDDKDGGNVSFLKACARMIIKTALGGLSFVVILATRRSQTIHDLLTRSTVQIRDAAKASSHQYIFERKDVLDDGMP